MIIVGFGAASNIRRKDLLTVLNGAATLQNEEDRRRLTFDFPCSIVTGHLLSQSCLALYDHVKTSALLCVISPMKRLEFHQNPGTIYNSVINAGRILKTRGAAIRAGSRMSCRIEKQREPVGQNKFVLAAHDDEHTVTPLTSPRVIEMILSNKM
ncbi:hypothetical protein BgiMline_030841 [Biomphalaria glabrata]|nr:hypothetical protein BgiMline_019123 [Biomphalaria glabrata]